MSSAVTIESPRSLADSLGLSLFPCKPCKRPARAWKAYQSRMATEREWDSWCGEFSSWGLVTGDLSGVIVVDTDNAEAELWAQEHLPHTPWKVLTGLRGDGSRGVHRYYRAPLGANIRNGSRMMGLKIDVRGNGGYVVAPGSTHPSGVSYEATAPWEPGEKDFLPVYDPAWFGGAQ